MNIAVEIEGLLVPPRAPEAGIWVGRQAESPETYWVGWGPVARRLVVPQHDALAVTGQDDPMKAAMLLPAAAIGASLARMSPAARAAVIGDDLIAALTRMSLESRCVPVGAEAELVVDTTGDPRLWDDAADGLHPEGELLLLVPPWSEPVDVNFYPSLHRRSLRVVAARWHRPPPDHNVIATGEPRRMVADITQAGGWIDSTGDPRATGQAATWGWLALGRDE